MAILLLLGLLAAAPPPAAVPAATAPPIAPIADLPMIEDHGHVFVSGTVGTSSGQWLALDTGAARSVLDADLAARLGIAASERGRAGGAGGVVDTAVARRVPVGLPGLPLGPLDLDVIPLAPISRHQGLPIALVLGHELFGRFVVELDYERHRLRIYDPATHRPAAAATSVPIDLVYDHPYLLATVKARGGASIRGRFVIDLGSAQSVILTPEVVRRHRLLEGTPTLKGAAGGIGGSFAVHIGRVASLAVGPFEVADVVAMLPLAGTLADAEDAVGNLGGGFLRRFRTTFDYSRQRLLLEPNGRFGEADETDMSGLSLGAAGEGLRAVAVERVREGSPGAEAGLRGGDSIVDVDGSPPGELGLLRLRELFRQAGTHRLTVLRGGRSLQVVLRTRRQI